MTTKSSAETAYMARKLVAAGCTAQEPKRPTAQGPSMYHYSTISSSYGTQIGLSDSFVARAMDPKRSQPVKPTLADNGLGKPLGSETQKKWDASMATREKKAAAWKFEAKPQNPLYVTSAHEIGYKRPAAHEFPDRMFPTQNQFTSTFNGMQYRDQGLNCSVDNSNFIDKGENAW